MLAGRPGDTPVSVLGLKTHVINHLGVGRTFHAVPFHASTNVLPPESPTAMHEVGVTHDTAVSSLLVAPTGLGDLWIFHAVPSHTSINVVPSE